VPGSPTSSTTRRSCACADTGQLPRSLGDSTAAISTPTTPPRRASAAPRIAIEATENNPYGNVIAVREKDREKPVLAKLVRAYQDPSIRAFILQRFDGAMLPVW
jgi:D-methionine transport system substrate-binding protein